MLKTYLVTSPVSSGCEVREREGNSNFSPPVGFDIIATVTVFVKLVYNEDVDMRSTFDVIVLTFVEAVPDAPVAEVA